MQDNFMKNNFRSLNEAICSTFGENAFIVKKERIHGGDINDAYRLVLSTGENVFLKTNSIKNFHFFQTESLGLWALRQPGMIGVPKVLAMGTDEQKGISFLLLEYMESAPRIKTYWETFGHQLAQLHKEGCALRIKSLDDKAKYGFIEDNYIGATPQKNTPREKWVDFYRECRLLPQIKMAERYFDAVTRKKFNDLLEHLDVYVREPEFPSLLHGDLWSGNVLCGCDGKAWILDPAVYVGDYETDLAMTQLFGSFPKKFYDAYNEINRIEKEYHERKPLYQLYHLLNHLNLFGGSYLSSALDVLNTYV